MDLQKLIDELQGASASSRHIDGLLAQLLGWEKIYTPTDDPSRPRIQWLDPATKTNMRFPDYTSCIDDAYKFAQQILPHHTGGVSWGDGLHQAMINDGPYCNGATSAIAVCLAALIERKRQEDEIG